MMRRPASHGGVHASNVVCVAGRRSVACSHVSDLTQPNRLLTDREGDTRYEIVELPLLTGTVVSGEAINEQGWVAGLATTSAGNVHATLWHDEQAQDLGTLGGPNSEVQWPGLNDHGTVVGFAETPDIQPLGEHWSYSAFFGVTGHATAARVRVAHNHEHDQSKPAPY
jgi:probable HAF family extracellular repeat protein